MILSHEEYFQLFPHDLYYNYTNVEDRSEIIEYGFLKWDDEESYCWAGPYEGNYTAYRISDHRNSKYPGGLKTIAETDKNQEDYYNKSVHYWPYKIAEKYFDKELLLEGMYFKCYVGDTLCSRSELTDDELKHLITVCTTDEMAVHVKKLVEAKTDPRWSKETPTIENPFILYLYGTDDCSYSIVFPSYEKAKEGLNSLSENPTFDNLKQLGGVFTN